MSISPDNLIPVESELAQMLRQWSEDTDTRTWNIARITNDLIEEVVGGDITKEDIYRAVATRCKGKKINTIRRWAELEMDFDRDIQDQYKELLSFEHFKVSRKLFKDGRTPSIDYALDWAVSGDDYKLTAGRFHTVGEVLNHFIPDSEFDNPMQKKWNKVKDDLYDHFLMVDNDNRRQDLLAAWNVIDRTLDLLTDSKVDDKITERR
jgi:hypothetical protein